MAVTLAWVAVEAASAVPASMAVSAAVPTGSTADFIVVGSSGFGVGPYAYYDDYPYYYDEGCYIVRHRVMTRYGWRIRPVQVCG